MDIFVMCFETTNLFEQNLNSIFCFNFSFRQFGYNFDMFVNPEEQFSCQVNISQLIYADC